MKRLGMFMVCQNKHYFLAEPYEFGVRRAKMMPMICMPDVWSRNGELMG